MASKTDDVRTTRFLRRVLWWALAAGVTLAGALAALLVTSGSAAAQPITVPGIGTVQIPDESALPPGLSGTAAPQPESAPIAAPLPTEFSAFGHTFTLPTIPGFEFPGRTGTPGSSTPNQPLLHEAPSQSPGEVAVEAARTKLGASYGPAAGPDSFDCSGLVQWSYGQAGVDLPRTSHDQLAAGTPVTRADLRPGDLVSFYGGGHSTLYAGDGKVIHASTYGASVTESSIDAMPFAGACRFRD
ncbi:hydrolase [Nocardia brasiliensis]|uniref:Hydrolase n=1 Tax=Nocardia brasiliensis TaxID=37326 RepID=A0A6G9XYX3_NOCBR|nr:C40 family peptidase [Nocardia brasiliensis]QIS06138.1 hydrolase [Nocardia brasiliensis]